MKSAVNDPEIYREAMEIGEKIRSMVHGWGHFANDTIGKQIVRSADSIAANLSEGCGHYHFKENRKFCYYSCGSAEETQTWIEQTARRFLYRAETCNKRPNACIRTIGSSDASTGCLMTADH